jgi:hypothetical protein
VVRDKELKLEDGEDSHTLITQYPDSLAESPFPFKQGKDHTGTDDLQHEGKKKPREF